MRYREQVRAIAMIAFVCMYIALWRSSTTGQQASQSSLHQTNQQQNERQRKKPQETGDESIKIQTELVQLDVKVVDQSGRPFLSLAKRDFEIYEDNVKQEIESVSREEVPVSTGLVIDTSGSMRAKFRTVSDAALSLIRGLRRDDEMFITQFKTETELVKAFTSDQRALETALQELYISGGTALLDAIIATADYAHENGKRRRKALVVITDGLEKNSSAKEKQVIQAMKEDEVQLYLVGFLDEKEHSGFFGSGANKRAKDLMVRLSDDSGGKAFFPEDLGEMPGIAAEIANDLRTQYVISYYPNNNKHDGAFHTIRVAVNPRSKQKLIVRTRQGYYARNDKGTSQ